ncbi:Sonic hedgehog protein A [Acipenser ruthenus]|uniref:Sonic hedgehog protein A n=1 Tax=Acipenser ruthenus TaxID=7906 RepID=A0A662YKX7_ACIRT|nr:Sonic hedgehog protein A [Acipenser ruthenus]
MNVCSEHLETLPSFKFQIHILSALKKLLCCANSACNGLVLYENSVAAKSGGCFPGSASVILHDGRNKLIKDLNPGDKVLAADEQGDLVFSDFMMFIDKDPESRRVFYVIETEEPHKQIALTAAHLLFVADSNATAGFHSIKAAFASKVKPGQRVFINEGVGSQVKPVAVKRIYLEEYEGSFAPVTAQGTIVVDQVLASCYAVIEEHRWAHWAFAPVRLSYGVASLLFSKDNLLTNSTVQDDENSVAAKSGGCFPGSASVILRDGRNKLVKDLNPGDKVLAADEQGNLVFSDFMMFIDKDSESRRVFYVIETEEPHKQIALTAAHLLFVADSNATAGFHSIKAAFASKVKPGQRVFITEGVGSQVKPVAVKRIYLEEYEGSFAPVTAQGTIVVDQVLASCYAVIEEHRWAHWAFAPVRLSYGVASLLFSKDHLITNSTVQDGGVHWYSNALYQLGTWVLDKGSFHPLGMSINSS